MSAAALIYLALTFIGIGISGAKHGEPRTGKYSFYATVFSSALGVGLLYWGGFFHQVSP